MTSGVGWRDDDGFGADVGEKVVTSTAPRRRFGRLLFFSSAAAAAAAAAEFEPPHRRAPQKLMSVLRLTMLFDSDFFTVVK